jgi:hypothetical protein
MHNYAKEFIILKDDTTPQVKMASHGYPYDGDDNVTTVAEVSIGL